MMAPLPALTTLLDRAPAPPLPLPAELVGAFGGALGFPAPAGRPYVLANFVTTLDGVVSYAIPGQADGGPISGHNAPDQFVMGLLRACAGAVVAGTDTLTASPGALWTPAAICPAAAGTYADLRQGLGLPPQPASLVVTGHGDLDYDAALFQNPDIPVYIVTTEEGAQHLATAGRLPAHVRVRPVAPAGTIAPAAILALAAEIGARRVLVEGGPHLLGTFLAARQVDELFLTLAPQLAGRDDAQRRPALVEGRAFLPATAPWARLLSAKSAGEHLYLRYGLSADA